MQSWSGRMRGSAEARGSWAQVVGGSQGRGRGETLAGREIRNCCSKGDKGPAQPRHAHRAAISTKQERADTLTQIGCSLETHT